MTYTEADRDRPGKALKCCLGTQRPLVDALIDAYVQSCIIARIS